MGKQAPYSGGFAAVMCLFAFLATGRQAFASLPPVAAPDGMASAFLGDWRQLHALAPSAGRGNFIVADIARQQLYLFKNGRLADTWPISTARRGAGERKGSYKTPLGVFEIVRKIGKGLPEYAVLTRHGPTGSKASPVFSSNDPAASQLIITRILML